MMMRTTPHLTPLVRFHRKVGRTTLRRRLLVVLAMGAVMVVVVEGVIGLSTAGSTSVLPQGGRRTLPQVPRLLTTHLLVRPHLIRFHRKVGWTTRRGDMPGTSPGKLTRLSCSTSLRVVSGGPVGPTQYTPSSQPLVGKTTLDRSGS